MAKSNFYFWQKVLTYANIVGIFIGIVTAFAGNSFLLEQHNYNTRKIFFGGNEFTPEVLLLKNWLFGIIGGTIVGFHCLMIMISENSFKKKEKWAYNTMWLGLLVWFCIDTGVSVFYKAFHNLVIINIPALIMISVPLLMTKNEFKKKDYHK